ncbi:MAG: hypothetical protein AAGD38_07680 [Acidobacteriota bacterium]
MNHLLGGDLIGNDFIGAVLISALFLSLLLIAELWRRWGSAPAEHTRKLVHIGGGLVCVFLPFLIERLWIIFLLAASLTGLFLLARRFGFLDSLHGVDRHSRGAEYFPLSVFLLLLIVGDDLWRYLAALLVLAVGDASAALIGKRYGRWRYQVDGNHKTVEGSLVFLLIAFPAILLPTLLMTDLPRPVCVLAALLVAVLVTFFEAISLNGTDNLFVPLGVAILLHTVTNQPLEEIAFQNLSLLGLTLIIALLVIRLPYLNTGSILTIILYAHGTWAFGAWHWALPTLTGLALYLLIWARVARHQPIEPIPVHHTVRALLGPFLLVALTSGLQAHHQLLPAYLGASATVLALALAEPWFRLPGMEKRPVVGVLGLGLIASVTVLGPMVFVVSDLPILPIVVLTLLATSVVVGSELRREQAPAEEWTAWRFLAGWGVAGILVV